ncbi:MAG: DUF4242 domain-containing protein [Solirubrobacteraceae bacterium]|nr:DUF4242 domain-containing protein [Solirubrobacteraceae bacterium]
MPRYFVTRVLGEISDEELDAAAHNSTRVREESFPDIGWEHSHVVRTPEGRTGYCVYVASDPDRIRAHAAAAGLPADSVLEIERDLLP